MKRLTSGPLSGCLLSLALLLQGCAAYSQEDVATAPVTDGRKGDGPGLWKVADEDTTIYLFGTVHALPDSVDWYQGPIESALAETQELVTEIPSSETQDPASQQMVMSKAILPADQSLREMLSDSDRTTYEAALTKLDRPECRNVESPMTATTRSSPARLKPEALPMLAPMQKVVCMASNGGRQPSV